MELGIKPITLDVGAKRFSLLGGYRDSTQEGKHWVAGLEAGIFSKSIWPGLFLGAQLTADPLNMVDTAALHLGLGFGL